ncbi:hypothetical protein FJY71_05445 [candidate division WOR-3 bacterium]|nr:hypothetical protein [candidate division WOR-3 bacterium]
MRAILMTISCIYFLIPTAGGQWLEKSIALPDSLSGLRGAGPMFYNPGSNTLFVFGSNGWLVLDGLSGRKIALTLTGDLYPGNASYASRPNKVYLPGGWPCYSLDGASGRVLAAISITGASHSCYSPLVNKAYVGGCTEVGEVATIHCANDSLGRRLTTGGWDAPVLCCVPSANKVYGAAFPYPTLFVIDCGRDSFAGQVSVDFQVSGLLYNRVSNRLYSWGYGCDSLLVIDPNADSVVGRVLLDGPVGVVDFNPVSNKVYCAHDSGVSVVCGYGDSLLASVSTGRRVSVSAFDSTDNLMWCGLEGSDSLMAIDGAGDTLCGAVALGARPRYIRYNRERNWLYVTEDTTYSEVVTVDPRTRVVTDRVLLNFTPIALCWAKSQNKLYCAGLNEVSLAAISTQRNRVERLVRVGQAPVALAYDRPLALVACANRDDASVSLIDCRGDTVTAAIDVAASPGLLCIDTVRHKLWCELNRGSNAVAVLDLRGESLSTYLPVGRSAALVSDAARGRVYCADLGGRQVVAVDAAGDSVVAAVPVGGTPAALCLIPAANLICCATAGNDAVAVIDGATNRVVDIVPVGRDPCALLFNPRRNKLYCSSAGSEDLTVIDCASMTPLGTIPTGSHPTVMALDSVGDRLYGVRPDGDVVTVIDCLRDTVVASLPVGDYPVALAYSSTHRRMYVANRAGAGLSVIRDTVRSGLEGQLASPGQAAAVPAVVRGVLFLPPSQFTVHTSLFDPAGRRVLALSPGANDVHSLSIGVYFVRAAGRASPTASVYKVVIQK